MKYNKQPISIADQISQLKNRGLIIDDEDVARKTLSVISYFRFANYLRPYEADKTNHVFKPGKLFSDAVSLYYFDKDAIRMDRCLECRSQPLVCNTLLSHILGEQYSTR